MVQFFTCRIIGKDGSDGEALIDVLSNLLQQDSSAAAGIHLLNNNEVQVIFFQTSAMNSVFKSYPEVVMIDGTYRVNKHR